jgi:hypothetical protein
VKLKLNRGGEKKMKKITIVSHGDLDGIISTVLLIKKFRLESLFKKDEVEIIFTQPWTVDKINPQGEKIFVVDIAVNNKNPEMTKEFISRIVDKLVAWYDHHQGWTEEITQGNPAFVIDPLAKSCAEIIGGDPELIGDAIAADRREGSLSSKAQLIEIAIKSDLKDNTTRLFAVRWLLGDETVYDYLEKKAKNYEKMLVETQELVQNFKKIEKVAIVDARGRRADLTQLLLKGEEIADFAVVLYSSEGEELIEIATKRKDVNLVTVFGLPSGAPFRISLPTSKFSLEFVIEKLNHQ